MSDAKKLTFDFNITGSVKFPDWFENIVAGFSAELKQDVVNEIIADDLEKLFEEHEAKNGVGPDENPLGWLDDPDFGANLGRKTAAQHAQDARARVAARRERQATRRENLDAFDVGRKAIEKLLGSGGPSRFDAATDKFFEKITKEADQRAAAAQRVANYLDPTTEDPFHGGLANSAKLNLLMTGLRANEDDPESLRKLAEATDRYAKASAKAAAARTNKKIH